MSLLTPSRTVLMISDDALFVYSSGAKGVKLVDTVPWGVESFEKHVATIIAKDCGGKPVVILNDMVEQHYRKERLPKVSPLDKQNVLQRKLVVAFPNYPVRAAMPLKEKARGRGKAGGGLYIFTAIPTTDGFTKTIGAARRSLAPIVGFGLLPIEASDMVKKLSEKLTPKGARKSVWTIFIGQHHGGGLRQVVIKNGEIALTRMTPVSEDISDVGKWTAEVFQEFKATMNYLTRFGFDSADGLDVIVTCGALHGEAFADVLDVPCNIHTLTPHEAADLLKIRLGVQENESYADVLHVAWCGRKNSLTLPLKAKEIERVSRPRQAATLASVVLALAMAGQGYQLMDSMSGVTANWDDIETQRNRLSQLNLHYQKEVKRKEDLGFDIQLIQSSLIVKEEFIKRDLDLFSFFANISLGLGRDMRIDRISIVRGETDFVPVVSFGGEVQQAKPSKYVATMQMTFPSSMDARKGNAEVEKLQRALQVLLKDHNVRVTKFLEDYEYSEAMVVQTGDAKQQSTAQDYVAEIRIEGPSYD